jgi:hypothetical protein
VLLLRRPRPPKVAVAAFSSRAPSLLTYGRSFLHNTIQKVYRDPIPGLYSHNNPIRRSRYR